VFSLVWFGVVALGSRFIQICRFVIPALVALIRCDRDDIPEVVHELAGWLHLSRPRSPDPMTPVRRRRQIGAGTGPPHRQDSRRPAGRRTAVRRRQRRSAKQLSLVQRD
jgi:hypothetical protein